MSDNELLDGMLPSLMDAHKTRRNRAIDIVVRSPEEWEPLRDLFARLSAEGLMTCTGTGRPSWAVALTDKGYTKYLPRITAMKALG